MNVKNPQLTVLMAAAFLLAALGSHAAPFTNGSFEIITQTAISPNNSMLLNPGDTWLTGWTAGGPGGNGLAVANGTINGCSPNDGHQWIGFNGGNTPSGGILSQTFDTTVGQSYSVTFYVAQLGFGNQSITATALALNSTVLAGNFCVPSTGVWTLFHLSFTALSTNTTLVFKDTSSQTIGVDDALDNVTVTAIPLNTPAITAFTNGSFEIIAHAAIPSGASGTLNPGDTWLTGWTVGGPGGDVFVNDGPNSGLNPYDGQLWVDFNGGNTPAGGSLSQTFTTTVGQYYTVNFAVGQTGVGNSSLTATALAQTGSLLASTLCVPKSELWTSFQMSFTAQSTNTTLVFTDTSSQVIGVNINLDAVSVVPGVAPVATTFTNGSFEIINHAAIPTNTSVLLNPGDTWLTGWTVGGPGGNGVAVANGTINGLSPYDGQQWIGFNGANTPPGGILSQTFATLVGQSYNVTFAVGQIGNGSVSITATTLASDNSLLASNYCVPSIGVWTLFHLAFTASSTNTTLVFKDTSPQTIAVDVALDAVSLVPGSAPNASTFTNGSFEIINHAAIPTNTSVLLNPGDTWLTGWIVGGPGSNGVAVANGTINGLSPYDGQQWIGFNGANTPPGGILSQTFATLVGQSYNVTFAVGQIGNGSVSITATALASGNSLLASNYCVPSIGIWTLFHLAFTASSTNTTLVFKDTSPQTIAVDIALDGVSVVAAAANSCTPPPSGIVGWWRAEGNTTDWSGTNNGILEGGATYGPGTVGQGFVDPGTAGAGVQLGTAASLQLQNFSIEAWIKLASVGTPTLSSSGGDGLIFGFGSGGYGFGIHPNGELFLTRIDVDAAYSTATISNTNFHHVALTKSGTSLIFYLDGVAYPYGSPYTSTFNFSDAAIGARGDIMTGNFYGTIDELAVYSSVLPASTIQSIYQSGASGKCTGLSAPAISSPPTNQTVAFGQTASFAVVASGAPLLSYQWVFNGAKIAGTTGNTLILPNAQFSQAGSYSVIVSNSFGSVTSSPAAILNVYQPACTPPPAGILSWWRAEGLADDWIGGNHGMLQGGVTYGPGEVGRAFAIPGSLAGVELGAAPTLQLQNFTIEAWVRLSRVGSPTLSGATGDGLIFGYGSGGYGFGIHPNGELFLTRIDVDAAYSTATISDTNFHHVGLTKTGPTVVFYLDGVAYPYGSPYSSTFTFSSAAIGARGDTMGGSFYGAIDDLAVYSRALTATEIGAIFNSGTAGKCAGSDYPFVFAPPATVSALAGTNLTLTAGADGSFPLSYQWLFNGTNLNGATSSTLTLTNVQTSQSGTYAVLVGNPLGNVTATNTFLTVTNLPAKIQVVNASVAGGGNVTVPVNMIANGNEAGVQFSLNFVPTNLTYIGASLGSGAAGAFFTQNTSQVASGHLGLLIGIPGGTFSAGTQQIVNVTFQAALLTNAISSPITFGASPIIEQLSDAQGNALSAVFVPGTVAISTTSIEGDVSPRTNGNELVSITDWVQEGLFVAGLQTTSNASEFLRADCAPRATGGDGVINVLDWVQVGRYAAGLDPLTAVGSPPGGTPSVVDLKPTRGGSPTPNLSTRTVSLIPTTQNAPTDIVSVQCATLGNENSLGFSVSFNPAVIQFVSASLGSGAAGATLVANTNAAPYGQLGFIVGLFPPSTFAAGTLQIVTLNFKSVYLSNTTSLQFANSPISCVVSDTNALALPASYQTGSLVVAGAAWPTLGVTASGTNVLLTWPVSPNAFTVQTLPDFGGSGWSNIGVTPVTNGGSIILTLPAPLNSGFYRLISP